MNDPASETDLPYQGKAMDVSQFKPFALIGVAVTGVAGCAALGALTNAVNGLVSPDYFQTILGWHNVADVWRASIARGILEGVMIGLVLSAIYTAVVGISSGARSSYLFAAAHLMGILAAALGCLAIGGSLAIGLATLSPMFYRNAFIGVPNDFEAMLRYAWVGGSIWGVEFGGVFCLVIGAVLFRARWIRQSRKEDEDDFSSSLLRRSTESLPVRAGESGLTSPNTKR